MFRESDEPDEDEAEGNEWDASAEVGDRGVTVELVVVVAGCNSADRERIEDDDGGALLVGRSLHEDKFPMSSSISTWDSCLWCVTNRDNRLLWNTSFNLVHFLNVSWVDHF